MHIHHGYWETGKETKEEAQSKLIDLLAKKASITPVRYIFFLCDLFNHSLQRVRECWMLGVAWVALLFIYLNTTMPM